MFDTATRYFTSLIDQGNIAPGGQLTVAIDGKAELAAVYGMTLGRKLRESDLHPGFCITKPLLGLAVGLLVDDELTTLDAVVESTTLSAASTGVPLTSLLNHEAGLTEPNAAAWRICPVAERWRLLAAASRADRPGYSEIAAGLVLEEFIEQKIGEVAEKFIETRIIDPLGLSEEIIISRERALELLVRRRTAVPFSVRPEQCIPLLSERLECQVAEIRPAFGALVSANGLCRLYTALGRVFHGTRVHGLPSSQTLNQLLAAVARFDEPSLGRLCSFAGGFMVHLEDHSFGHNISSDSFGHSTGITHSAAFCDPARRLAAAYYLNGSCIEDLDQARSIRRHLVTHILEDADHDA